MNAEQRQVAADPQTRPPDLGCESTCRLLSFTTTIAIYYLLLLSPKADTHLLSHGGQKAELTYVLQEGCAQPMPKAVNHSGLYDKHCISKVLYCLFTPQQRETCGFTLPVGMPAEGPHTYTQYTP